MSHSSASSPLLRVTALNVGFRQQPLLHNISFDLDYGEVLALVGESGSGKSLTALSIIGLLPAAAQIRGSIHFAGRDLLTADARALHSLRGKNIAMIFQDARQALDPLFTIGQQLTETLHRHDPGLRRQQAQQQAITLLEEVEIANAASQYHAYPHQLSGGQCQRVMIAIALAGQPQLLIADEPTTALDVTVQKEILQLLRRLRQQRAIAILLITHDMGVVADSADRVLVLRDGRMTEQATVSALFSQPQTAYSRQLLDAVLRLESPQYRQPDGASAPPITIDRLQVNYLRRGKKFTALQDISLTLEAGSTLGIVGESGSGKSTLGRALAGLVPIAAGDIYLDGIPLRQASPAQWLILRRKIGMVFQSPRSAINPRFTL
ncbi:ATP-binding cassette domain-containing protein, partial [Winslowiella iniecta]